MKKLALAFLSTIVVACSTLATEPAAAPVISISTDEIHADSGVLRGRRLVSSGQPDREILSSAKAAGFKAIIDLRGADEDRGFDEAAAVTELGMTYIALPVRGAQDVNFDNAEKLDTILNDIDGPVLLHCASGNRVGALVALRASLNGASDDDALKLGTAAGLTRLEPVVIQRLQAK